MELISVAAVAENGVIGRDGELPWPSIPADKDQYRRRVADSPVVLGRRTFESMAGDLPGGAQIVVSRTEGDPGIETATYVDRVDAAIAKAEELGADAVYVLGGGGIYELFQPHLDRMFLSRVPGEYDGDIYYPSFETDEWELERETAYERFTLEEWRRIDDGRSRRIDTKPSGHDADCQ